MEQETRMWVAEKFGVAPEDVVAYHSGNCYDTVWVKNIEAAETIASQMKGKHVNGGWFHGMSLGNISTHKDTFMVTI